MVHSATSSSRWEPRSPTPNSPTRHTENCPGREGLLAGREEWPGIRSSWTRPTGRPRMLARRGWKQTMRRPPVPSQFRQRTKHPDREPIKGGAASHGTEGSPGLYMRLVAIVRQQIIDGKLRPGGPAPSTTFLSQEHRHARPTCSRAMRILEDEGLLTRIPGLGYYVNHG